jgi:hypothetical protein
MFPVTCAPTFTDIRQRRKDNTSNDDCDARELQRLGNLINIGVDLSGQFPNLSKVQQRHMLEHADIANSDRHACRLHMYKKLNRRIQPSFAKGRIDLDQQSRVTKRLCRPSK